MKLQRVGAAFRSLRTAQSVLLAASCLAGLAGEAQAQDSAPETDALAAGFADPPASARPRVWWHWMNGNVTKDGIAKDLAWMKRVGIGGLQNFDANLTTPQIVPERLVYMHPEWKDAFRFAAGLADQLGLEMAIAASPGWSETGGPWVEAKDGLKKLVWSTTDIAGGKRFSGKIAPPPSVTGPFQSLEAHDPLAVLLGGDDKGPQPHFYADIAVLAFPASVTAAPKADVAGPDGKPVDAGALDDDSLDSAIAISQPTAGQPAILRLNYAAPRTIRSATLYLPGAKSMFTQPSVAPRLEASNDGTSWQVLAPFDVNEVPTTVSFAPVTAKYFRLVIDHREPSASNMGDPMPGLAQQGMFGNLGAAPPLKIAKLHLSEESQVDRFEAKAGFAIASDYLALGGPAELAGVDPAQVVNLTGRLAADGTLDWSPPKGQWRVVRLGYSLLGTTNHPATPEATGLEVDKFDGQAVRNYLEHYIGMYRDAAGAELIGNKGVRALLTDSIEVGAANWTPRMIERFKALRGYDPTPWLPALTGVVIGSRAQSDGFLYDFRRTLADLMASEHYGTVADVAHAHGLKVYGEALEDNRPSLGDDMAMRAHADVPMAAMWTHSRAAGPNPSYLADIKGAASVAHIYGQNLVAAESLTSAMAPWAYAPNELRRMIDLEFATGVNRPVIHTSVHQPVDDKVPGLSLAIFGQYFNRHESWAEMARPWVDYIARTSFLLQQGNNVADVAYFYGEEAPLTGLYGHRRVADAPTRYAYDFVNPDVLLNRLEVQDGDLVARSGARYRVLYLGGSSARMTLATLQRVASLAEAGATVVGTAPTSSPGLGDDKPAYAALVQRLWSGTPVTQVGKGRVIAGHDVEAALGTIGANPDFAYAKPQADSELLFVHRRSADGDIYFVDNRANRPEHVEARFRVTGKQPELWHADTGLTEPVSYRIDKDGTSVSLDLNAEEAVFVVFRRPAGAASATIARTVPNPVGTIAGPWAVSFQPRRGAPASATFGTLGSLSDQTDPGIKYFSGVATYTHGFALPEGVKPGAPLWLDLGQVAEVAEVRVNGALVGTAWHAPYRLDIGKAVKPGQNQLEVRVANLWVNRLIGDQQPGAAKITWTALPTYRADAPLRPSGLIGPVQLLSAEGR